jgi:transcription antitermination factor NusG
MYNPENIDWLCAVTNPNCQARACLELHSIGFLSFYPKARRWRRHARTMRAVERPILDRYIFVGTPRDCGVAHVNGIESYVSIAGFPVVIPASDVADMRARYMAGEWDEIAREERDGRMPIGARVRIVQGEFENMLGVLISRRKVRVIRDADGNCVRNTVTEVNRKSLRAA